MNVLIAGLGNEIMGDDGVGIHALRVVAREPRFASMRHLRFVEVGTAVLDVLDDLEWADHVVMLDAVQVGGAPGNVYCVSDVCLAQAQAGLHGLNLIGAAALLGPGTLAPSTSLIGIEPERIGYTLELSPSVARALPRMAEHLWEHLAELKAVCSSPV